MLGWLCTNQNIKIKIKNKKLPWWGLPGWLYTNQSIKINNQTDLCEGCQGGCVENPSNIHIYHFAHSFGHPLSVTYKNSNIKNSLKDKKSNIKNIKIKISQAFTTQPFFICDNETKYKRGVLYFHLWWRKQSHFCISIFDLQLCNNEDQCIALTIGCCKFSFDYCDVDRDDDIDVDGNVEFLMLMVMLTTLITLLMINLLAWMPLMLMMTMTTLHWWRHFFQPLHDALSP